MEIPLCMRYRRCEIRACALVEPLAGEGLELGALYQPLAVVCWYDAGGRHEAHLLDPKHHVFRSDADAVRLSIALAKRFIDTKLAGASMPAG
ncbi:hypothetical protein [Burkholderia pseudomultivorans]|uniref:Uncharacterized protein n=1 Tax=Burkholderia pseudomultivorans TaxID=1207504 RepID=A0A132E7E3_9BURK|nr:hypothetical protein [Burkholderia pseudomultivorans]KWF16738.1 hypothetical protein WT56_33860 [Burkholderia pseudomultivorans]MDR8732047.1 hypothetical protein [Burkholderia pseudomultivorans]MDR8737361.1 hypothetical protein [Burkholderia pseudomultivorans]MDR8743397.1 hypothetical protein [Burkholderia pseudomultivorans]MDR8756982.1 hypothetical protein [Burkholderia pseudomultivorans]